MNDRIVHDFKGKDDVGTADKYSEFCEVAVPSERKTSYHQNASHNAKSHFHFLLPVAAILLLAGCSAPQIDPRPVIELSSPRAQPPAELVALCKDPGALPATALSAGQIERLWAADRAELVSCGMRHDALVQFYRGRDAGLAGVR